MWAALLSMLALPPPLAVAQDLPQITLEGCEGNLDRAALRRLVEREMPRADNATLVLHARFDCVTLGRVELSIEGGGPSNAVGAEIDLAEVPEHARPRMLALVWAEQMRSQGGPLEAPQPSAVAVDDVTSPDVPTEAATAPSATEPARAQLSRPKAPAARAPAHPAPRASRRAMWSSSRARGSFEVAMGPLLRSYLKTPPPLFGAALAVRWGPAAVHATYAQSPERTNPLGGIEGRVVTVGAGLTPLCAAWLTLESCAVLTGDVGRGQVAGHAIPSLSTAAGLDSLYLASALAAPTRLSGKRVAVELAPELGLAYGPTAAAGGRDRMALQGMFMGLQLTVVVQP